MSRPLLASLLAGGCMLFATPTALAHPPSEEVVGTLSRSDGSEVVVVMNFVDGILAVDPVQVVLRDGTGRTLDETEFTRDVVATCDRTSCAIYVYGNAFAVAPTKVLEIRGDALVRSPGHSARGALLHLAHHLLGYLAATLVLATALGLLVKFRLRWRSALLAGIALASLLLWWYVVAELSRLSLTLVALLALLLLVALTAAGSSTIDKLTR